MGTRPDRRDDAVAGSTGVAIAAGGDTWPSEEAKALLRVRLRAAGLFLAVAVALLQVRDLVVGGGAPWPLQVDAILALGLAFILLSLPGAPSARRLRQAEVVIFGLAALVLASRQYHAMLSWAARGDEA